ncbi:MAG: hypothetical protein A2W25_16340 [candidate division Zixibacteria bacterium RBG_16_53_22]|nr:MAG: hypothetical protein A2W25_16340 [candidate division Zixibacteria bacterium RBG_16_53_22]
MTDPSYRARMGIDQGLPEPLFEPVTTLTNFNFLAIVVGFSDRPGVTPPVYFDSLVFGVNSGSWGPTLRAFYNRASYGNFTIVTVNYPSATGWGVAPGTRYYYTAQGGPYSYGMGLYPNNSQGLCEWVAAAIDPLINFANYDNNGDGWVDGIIMIHAGRGAEVSGDSLDIWSHAWNITPQTRDGVFVSSYCTVPEYWNAPLDNTIGVFCHEFGHVLGLPDFYDYGNDSHGLGFWSLMAYGSWNGNGWGFSPAFLDAWSRVFLGFVTPINVGCNLTPASIPAVQDSARVYRLWTLGAAGSQYYLLEYRNRSYTDTALVTPGITIYHVDDTQTNNNNQWWPGMPPAFHYKVALEQADNAFDLEHFNNPMDTGDPYPGVTGNLAFTDFSFPSARDYIGSATQVSVTGITFPTPGMANANLGVGLSGGTPAMLLLWWPLTGYAFNFENVSFGWQADPYAITYHLQLDDDINFGSPLLNDSTLTNNYYYNYSFLGHSDGPYYWRARGIGCGAGPWSGTQTIFRDTQPPYGCVASSPDTAHSSFFLVTWNAATDPPPSSGMLNYFVFCDSGNGYQYFHMDSTQFSALYTGARDGHKYYFYAISQDNASNVEAWSGLAECSTYVDLAGGPGCDYVAGDINDSGAPNGIDVTYGVTYLKGGSAPKDSCDCPPMAFPFYAAMDVNGTCSVNGIDITFFVAYLKGQQPALLFCASCPPAGMAAPPGPAVMPINNPSIKERGNLRPSN